MKNILCLAFLSIIVRSLSYSIEEIPNDIDVLSRENLPKPVTYFTLPPTEDTIQNSEKSQGARLTYPAGGTNVESYGHNVLAHGYYPWKFDIGGVLLGSVVGLGALLLIPKLIHLVVPELTALGPAYGALYKRNVDFLPQGINEIVSQFEGVLAENNINSSECLQKAICSYVQLSSSGSKTEETKSTDIDDNDIEKSVSNTIINFLTEGSKFKSAVENGKRKVSCSVFYPKCPFNQDSVVNGIKQLLLNNTTTFPQRESNSRSSL